MGATVQTIYNFIILMWTETFPRLDWVLIVFMAVLSWGCALHALLSKSDPRAALGWIAVCLMFPPVGPLFYFLFGINRVITQGRRLGGPLTMLLRLGLDKHEEKVEHHIHPSLVPETHKPIAVLSDKVTRLPLLSGNRLEPLINGEEAFPAMLKSIEQAQHSVYLTTFIFETNTTGRQFIDALKSAMDRGVDVRVILDGLGEYYHFPRAGKLFKRTRIPVVRFLPPKLLPPSLYLNLRNHRKILVVDSHIGFTGGMNIGDRHLAAELANPSRVEDIHFRITGPVVRQMEQVFLADWCFCDTADTPEPKQEPLRTPNGSALCRVVVDGPNEEVDRLALILVGAVAAARKRVYIMTPYFLPSRELVGALQTAALRGVDVRVILPEKNNLPYVKWASNNILWNLLQKGVRIYYQPPPFVHTKLFMVDHFYTIIGSTNIDPRSLRLNFEMVLEVYDEALNNNLTARFNDTLAKSRETTLTEVDQRPLVIKIRDSLCWLFTPYL